MTSEPKDMLDQYRATTTAEFRPVVEAFRKMSLAERDELTFYVVSYMTQQYAALLGEFQKIVQMIGRPPDGGGQGPHGRPN